MGTGTVLLVGKVIAAAAAVYGGVSAYEAQRDAKRAAEKQAEIAKEQAASEASNIRDRGRRLIASQRAALAASGVKIDEGTGDALQQETKKLTEQDALATLKTGSNQALLYDMEAKVAGNRGKAALVSGALDATSTAVSGYASYQKAKAPSVLANRTSSTPRYSLLNGNNSGL